MRAERSGGYIDLGYKPTKNDLVCEFYVEPAEGVSIKEAVEAVAGESSIGTWTHVVTMKPEIREKLRPHIFSMEGSYVRIAYPQALFEPTNIPQILSSVAGNIFGMKMIENLRLEDIDFPDIVIDSCHGPNFGIEGVRRYLNVMERPLVGTIIKPKLGLNAKEHAQVAYEAWIGGCDIVKDDENLTSMEFNKFEDRVVETLDMRDKASQETGDRKVYMPNVTAETDEMLRRAEFVQNNGGKYIMVDILTVGFAALQTLRNHNADMIIHAHRAMHAAVTRNERHGISMLVIAKLARLIGVDQIHIGTVVGKMEDTKAGVVAIRKEIEENIIQPDQENHVLREEWHKVKPVFAVCSGGLHPGHVPKLIELMGKDIIIQAGGGVHGHPHGTIAGATAMRQAVEAVMNNVPLTEHAHEHKELKAALDKWGVA